MFGLQRNLRLIQAPEQQPFATFHSRLRCFLLYDVVIGILFVAGSLGAQARLADQATLHMLFTFVVGCLFLLDAALLKWLLVRLQRLMSTEKVLQLVKLSTMSNTVTCVAYLLNRLVGELGGSFGLVIILVIAVSKISKVFVIRAFGKWITTHWLDGRGYLGSSRQGSTGVQDVAWSHSPTSPPLQSPFTGTPATAPPLDGGVRPNAEQATQQPNSVLMTVPAGYQPGSMIETKAPDGQVIRVVLPAGVQPGQQIQVQL